MGATLTVDELKKMWEPAAQGKVTKWKQVNASVPDAPIKLFGAGADSGTFDYFTEAINGKANPPAATSPHSEDDNVLVQGVSRDVNALGFFGWPITWRTRTSSRQSRSSESGGKSVLPSSRP